MKKTLKQMEDELKFYQSFEKLSCSGASIDYLVSTLLSDSDDRVISYNDINKMSLGEKVDFCLNLHNGTKKDNINIAVITLYVLGFSDLAHSVNEMAAKYSTSKALTETIVNLKNQINQRKLNGEGGKKRTSKHKDEALKIASDTWKLVPGASMPSLARKIHEHLSGKYRGLPEPGTIQTWLKESGLNPNFNPKTKDYDLLVKY